MRILRAIAAFCNDFYFLICIAALSAGLASVVLQDVLPDQADHDRQVRLADVSFCDASSVTWEARVDQMLFNAAVVEDYGASAQLVDGYVRYTMPDTATSMRTGMIYDAAGVAIDFVNVNDSGSPTRCIYAVQIDGDDRHERIHYYTQVDADSVEQSGMCLSHQPPGFVQGPAPRYEMHVVVTCGAAVEELGDSLVSNVFGVFAG